jgi:hypothetical protein
MEYYLTPTERVQFSGSNYPSSHYFHVKRHLRTFEVSRIECKSRKIEFTSDSSPEIGQAAEFTSAHSGYSVDRITSKQGNLQTNRQRREWTRVIKSIRSLITMHAENPNTQNNLR